MAFPHVFLFLVINYAFSIFKKWPHGLFIIEKLSQTKSGAHPGGGRGICGIVGRPTLIVQETEIMRIMHNF